ncbi:GntR family transcriptional regulator [Terasakiella sp. A23]|uniref:GntR family transcriptional regulator n=1 Tax=Terasakiella sp. FCG-A23 TaxID=3080561 RepID=UPI0029536372|nr:GntR family transcriptional regulator [Terasakiella sp. A23]MDV7340575.1 GntR family transcriptional regulator [Terasakiella sp. A23]
MATAAVKKLKSKTPKVPIAEQAYAELKRRILENELPTGHQLMEGEVADLLEISRTPAREAMMRLETEGLVEVRPRHGMKVKPVSVSDMKEIYALLTGLESTAAWQAAMRDHTDEEIQALRDSVDQMDEALKAQDLDAWANADATFHRLLVEMSGNQRLIELVSRFIDQSHRVRKLTLRLRPMPAQSNEDHSNVVDAIVAKNAEEARRIHRIHREKAGFLLVELLESHGLTQL